MREGVITINGRRFKLSESAMQAQVSFQSSEVQQEESSSHEGDTHEETKAEESSVNISQGFGSFFNTPDKNSLHRNTGCFANLNVTPETKEPENFNDCNFGNMFAELNANQEEEEDTPAEKPSCTSLMDLIEPLTQEPDTMASPDHDNSYFEGMLYEADSSPDFMRSQSHHIMGAEMQLRRPTRQSMNLKPPMLYF